MNRQLSRRNFLERTTAAASGLLVRFYLPGTSKLDAAPSSEARKLNAFVHIAPNERVTLYIHKAEMGQGTVTSLSMLLAEELECDWKTIHTEFPGVNREYGASQGVVGSASIRTSWEPLRRAGATAREMLVAAAAQRWGVERSRCRAEDGAVVNIASKARLTYGSLAENASKQPPHENVILKDPSHFRLIGKPTRRLDTPAKVDGSATFGIDVRLPGMLYAVVVRCPVFGGKVASFDAAKAKATPGVKNVIRISNGVAVLADNTWSAMQGRRALQIHWDEGAVADVNTAGITKSFIESMGKSGAEARREGEAAAQLAAAAKRIEAAYEAPYLAHAPMEPLNCTAVVRADACEVWASTQGQTAARAAAAFATSTASPI
jgi:isoquinoline 1-oxidoreductase beta subunit